MVRWSSNSSKAFSDRSNSCRRSVVPLKPGQSPVRLMLRSECPRWAKEASDKEGSVFTVLAGTASTRLSGVASSAGSVGSGSGAGMDVDDPPPPPPPQAVNPATSRSRIMFRMAAILQGSGLNDTRN